MSDLIKKLDEIERAVSALEPSAQRINNRLIKALRISVEALEKVTKVPSYDPTSSNSELEYFNSYGHPRYTAADAIREINEIMGVSDD